jgi:hypothetical protein
MIDQLEGQRKDGEEGVERAGMEQSERERVGGGECAVGWRRTVLFLFCVLMCYEMKSGGGSEPP